MRWEGEFPVWPRVMRVKTWDSGAWIHMVQVIWARVLHSCCGPRIVVAEWQNPHAPVRSFSRGTDAAGASLRLHLEKACEVSQSKRERRYALPPFPSPHITDFQSKLQAINCPLGCWWWWCWRWHRGLSQEQLKHLHSEPEKMCSSPRLVCQRKRLPWFHFTCLCYSK